MRFKNKNVLIAGLGISGQGAAKLLRGQNANLFLFDESSNVSIEFAQKNEKIYLEEFPFHILSEMDYLVLSPGISAYVSYAEEARRAGVSVIGEIELAFLIAKGKIIAITGTNGKTTTTALVGEIMKSFFENVYVVGNIGTSFASIADKTKKEDIIVAEISSFQLETIDFFKPSVSAVLNLTPDHLDRHGDMGNYLQVKMKIAQNQGPHETCVVNFEDEMIREAAEKLSCKKIFFSSKRKIENGIYLDKGNIILHQNNTEIQICKTVELKVLGVHNFENVMAAVGMALAMGVDLEQIKKVLKDFVAIEHRIEYVDEKNGVIFYNDSKGTNPDASKKAIEAMNRPTILLAGGYDKQAVFDEWIKSFENKIKYLILMGDTKEKIKEAAIRQGFTDILIADSFKEAMDFAIENASPGDAVLLSPACASWGMFENYEERGNQFKQYVRDI